MLVVVIIVKYIVSAGSKMKSLIFKLAALVMVLGMVGCKATPRTQSCESRNFTVNVSTKLTLNQRSAFVDAMKDWTTALGPGFWTLDFKDVDLDVETVNDVDAQLDPCLITATPADVPLIGKGHVGLAVIIAEPDHHLIDGVVEILNTETDDESLGRICRHEIGHLLGLDDSQNQASVMFWTIAGPPVNTLPASDVAEVKALWNLPSN
jgi:predicted Zn-dependent protease